MGFIVVCASCVVQVTNHHYKAMREYIQVHSCTPDYPVKKL